MRLIELPPDEYNKFVAALRFTLDWETGHDDSGGYTDDPDDPGGETKWGIAARYHPDLNIKELTLEEAIDIYYEEYWVVANCNAFPASLAVSLFDSAVNTGPARAVGFLKASQGDPSELVRLRKAFYAEKVKQNPAKQKYLAGWLNRCNDLLKYCELLDLKVTA